MNTLTLGKLLLNAEFQVKKSIQDKIQMILQNNLKQNLKDWTFSPILSFLIDVAKVRMLSTEARLFRCH